MIRGGVNARCEAIVRLRLRGAEGAEMDIGAIVDSGFTASLALPAATVSALGLVRQSAGSATLADGTVRQFDIHTVNVHWDGRWRPKLVSAVGNDALVGMRLLRGCRLEIDVVPGGAVEIAPLS